MKFSIITVSFNSSSTISRTIDSILSQTYNDYEYIIVDGGSKDGTLDIIKSYQERFSGNYKWISEPDDGIFPAMNKGIKMAHGNLIGIVNSDDWLESNALEIIAKYYDNNCEIGDNCLYCGAICYHYKNYSQIMMPNRRMYEKNVKRLLLKGIWHPSTFVPLKIYNKIGLFDENFKIMADYDFIYRCYSESVYFTIIEEVISNMSYGGASNNFGVYFKDYKKLLSKNNYKGTKYYYYYIKEYLRILVRHLSPNWLIRLYRSNYNMKIL